MGDQSRENAVQNAGEVGKGRGAGRQAQICPCGRHGDLERHVGEPYGTGLSNPELYEPGNAVLHHDALAVTLPEPIRTLLATKLLSRERLRVEPRTAVSRTTEEVAS